MFNGMAAMMPTLQKLFGLRRRVLDPGEAEPVAAATGIAGAAVVRFDGTAEGEPFVMFLAMPAGSKSLPPA